MRRTVVTLIAVVVALAAALLPAGASPQATKPAKVDIATGKLETVVSMLRGGGSRVEYRLRRADGTRLALHPKYAAGLALKPAANATVTVGGTISDTDMSVSNAHVVAAAPAATAAGPHRLAVIVVRYAGASAAPIPTNADIANTVFNASKSTANYWSKMSGGKVSISGTVFGPFVIAAPANVCDPPTILNKALAAVPAATLAGYDLHQVWFPGTVCPFAGQATFPGNDSWIQSGTTAVLDGYSWSSPAHEIGHNLGLMHGNALRCSDGTGHPVALNASASLCTHDEYGDPTDVMAIANTETSNYHKAMLGGIVPLRPTQSGTYTLLPAEADSSLPSGPTASKAIVITRPDNTEFWLEFRQRVGPYDVDPGLDPSFTTGVSVRLVNQRDPFSGYWTAELLDMTPGSLPGGTPARAYDLTDAALAAGRTFTDPASTFRLTVNSVSSAGASVTITVPLPPPPPVVANVSVTSLRASFDATPGIDDRITVATVATARVRFNDTTVNVKAGAGCAQIDDHTAECGPVQSVTVNSGNSDDRIDASGLAIPSTLNGGAGSDVLIGGVAADVFSGGGGIDTVDYSTRTTKVSLSNDGHANDGKAGERDNIATDVETLVGGRIGDALRGGAGADHLVGGPGKDTYNGGAGNDLIDARDGTKEAINCSSGTDTALTDVADRPSRTCEAVQH